MKNRVMKYGIGIFALALFGSSAAIAGNLGSLPNTFSANTTAKASEVNANFEAARVEIDDNANSISSNTSAIASKQSRVTGTCSTGQTISQINADGSVVCSSSSGNGVSFSAQLSANIIPTGSFVETPLIGFSNIHDDGNNFDLVNGIYTIPSDGVYQFSVNVSWTAATTLSDVITMIRLYNNGSIFHQVVQRVQLNSAFGSSVMALGLVKATAGDTITFGARYSDVTPITISGGGGSGQTTVAGFKVY